MGFIFTVRVFIYIVAILRCVSLWRFSHGSGVGSLCGKGVQDDRLLQRGCYTPADSALVMPFLNDRWGVKARDGL
jgi:hypothetical protein